MTTQESPSLSITSHTVSNIQLTKQGGHTCNEPEWSGIVIYTIRYYTKVV